MIRDIKLLRGQIMTRDDILKQISAARVGYDYLKIQMYNGVYLQVFFTRDYKSFIKTNLGRDLLLLKEIDVIERISYRPESLADFLFRWIKKLNI